MLPTKNIKQFIKLLSHLIPIPILIPNPNPILNPTPNPIPIPIPIPILIPTLILTLLPSLLFSQQPFNPGLEGTPQMDIPPDEWMPCKYNSTPDTHPTDILSVTKPASEGNTYLGLVTRGNNGGYANSTEACGTWLTTPMRAGSCYKLVMDLHMSTEVGHYADWTYWQSYANPVKLLIWGSNGYCAYDELLYETLPIFDKEWTTYEFIMSPEIDGLEFIILEAQYASDFTYFGNIMIDNISILYPALELDLGNDTIICDGEEFWLDATAGSNLSYLWNDGSSEPVKRVSTAGTYIVTASEGDCSNTDSITVDIKECIRCYFYVPNAITPNADGLNDAFAVTTNCEPLKFDMRIYNRLGELVFRSDDYLAGWNGKGRSGTVDFDVYYYRIDYTIEDWGVIKDQFKEGNLIVIEN